MASRERKMLPSTTVPRPNAMLDSTVSIPYSMVELALKRMR